MYLGLSTTGVGKRISSPVNAKPLTLGAKFKCAPKITVKHGPVATSNVLITKRMNSNRNILEGIFIFIPFDICRRRAGLKHLMFINNIKKMANQSWKKGIETAIGNLFFYDIVRGMMVALSYMFVPKATLYYPFEKGYLSPRFRGEHALRRYPTGLTQRSKILITYRRRKMHCM